MFIFSLFLFIIILYYWFFDCDDWMYMCMFSCEWKVEGEFDYFYILNLFYSNFWFINIIFYKINYLLCSIMFKKMKNFVSWGNYFGLF